MGLGLGVLRLPPAHFWRLTPKELACIIEALHGSVPPPLGREELESLIQGFPD